jgi:hypothetical protein
MNARLLSTPNEEVWPGVGKLPNLDEYPKWNVSKLSVIASLDADGIDLLEVSHRSCAFVFNWILICICNSNLKLYWFRDLIYTSDHRFK